MDMKPEYNHGYHKDTEIRLLEQNIGDKPSRLKYIFRQIEAGKIEIKSHKNWFHDYDYYDGRRVVLYYRLTDEAEVRMILEKLKWAGTKPDVCYNIHYYAVPPDSFSKIVDWRRKPEYKRLSFGFRSSSHELTAMNEYSLSLWAKAYSIEEAYRLCIFPSFKPPQVIRIWFHRNTAYCVHKELIPSFCPDKPKIINAENISVDKWFELKTYMNKFWPAKSWYSVPELYVGNDGTTYFFEGWRDGKYKVLDDHSPDDGVSWYAIELFKSIAKYRSR